MGSKKRKQMKGESGATEEGKEMITDPRFSSAHTDPRFRRVPRHESKVTIDSRFKGALTDKRFATASAPVDKRGKRRRRGSMKDSLKEFYRIDEEKEESEKEIMDLKSEASSEEESKSELNWLLHRMKKILKRKTVRRYRRKKRRWILMRKMKL